MEMMLLVDPKKCTGCRLCELVCSVKHSGVSNPYRSRVHVMKWPSAGYDLPMLCPQCENAPCVIVCPRNALARDHHLSRVSWNSRRCIGCRMCVMVCPLGAMGVDPTSGQVFKCDLCDGSPACASICLTGAIRYVPPETANLLKKREAGLACYESMMKHALGDL